MKSGMHKTATCLFAGTMLCLATIVHDPAAAQEYTLQDFVNDADAIVVAEIISKKAERVKVRTRQLGGWISEDNSVTTIYGIAVNDFIGDRQYSGIREFVLPGGVIGNTEVRWTHTPEFEIGMHILVAVEYDELNQDFSIRGVPPIGRSGGVFIASKLQGREIFTPYLIRGSSGIFSTSSGDLRITEDIDSETEMLDVIASPATDYHRLISAIREASNERK